MKLWEERLSKEEEEDLAAARAYMREFREQEPERFALLQARVEAGLLRQILVLQ
jgi:hypothetical protein